MSDTRPSQTENPYSLLEQYLSGSSSHTQSSEVDRLLAPKKCEICGASFFEDSKNSLSQYCPRHGYIISRVQDLMEDRDHTKDETRLILAQAEAEADQMFAAKTDNHRKLDIEVTARREIHARGPKPSAPRPPQELKERRQPRKPASMIDSGKVATILAILLVGVMIPLLGLDLFLSSLGTHTLELWPLPGFLGAVAVLQGSQADLLVVPILALLLIVVGIGWVLIERKDGKREN